MALGPEFDEIDVPITEQELDELRDGKHFHWNMEGKAIHLFVQEESYSEEENGDYLYLSGNDNEQEEE